MRRNKKSVQASGTRSDYGKHKPTNVKDLLASSLVSARKIRQVSDRKQILLNIVRERLEPALRERVIDAALADEVLTLYARSAAWAARLRFAAAGIDTATLAAGLGAAAIGSIVVRIRP
jgi:hypothetical protein